MRPLRYRLVPLVLLVALVGVSLSVGIWLITRNGRSDSDPEYFPRTSHNVQGEFLAFFRENGGLESFGYPITEEFLYRNRVVQYFQNARLELHPEADPPNRVQPGHLAEEMGLGTPPVQPPASDPEGRYFSQTGHWVGTEFFRFFNEKGGARLFGYPITEVFAENEVKVQYFQNARMELHPDRPGVRLAALGDVHFDYARLDPYLRKGVSAIQAGSAGEPTRQIGEVDAKVAKAYAWYPGQQTLYVYVTDKDDQAIPGANVSYTVEYPDSADSQSMPPTDNKGYTSTTFDLKQLPIGQKVFVQVTAVLGKDAQEAQTSFFLWP